MPRTIGGRTDIPGVRRDRLPAGIQSPPVSAVIPTELRRAFRDVRLAHVATLQSDGAPHVVPLWFVWLEDAVYLTCRSGSRV
jgi:hypothetical protein